MLGARPKTVRLNFTKDAIQKLPLPESGRQYVWDQRVVGLAICLTPAGGRTFYHYRKVDGKPQRIRLGAWPEITVEQARNAASSHNGKIAEGENPAVRVRARRDAPTLGAVFETFIDLPTRTKAKRPKSPVTLTGYRQQFNTCLADWKDRKLSTITRTDVEVLHNQIGTERGRYMANRVLGLLKTLFNTAIDTNQFAANPAARVRAFEEESRERFLQADELPKFWKALEAEPSEKVRDFIKVALFTGQRRMNCLQMKWEDVNLERAVWSIPHTKTGRHAVPLTTEALELLKRRLESRGDSEYVFPGLHDRGHLKDPMRQWRQILERAGIEHLRIHDLRRSLGSWAATTGASLSIIGKALGHSRPETTAIYSRLEMAPVRTAMQAATTAIIEATEPKPAAAKPVRKAKAKQTGKRKAK